MFRYLLLVSMLLLSSCASVDRTSVKLSSATINKISYIKNSDGAFEFSFDYIIDNFVNTKNIYFCSVHVLAIGGKTIMSPVEGESSTCSIDTFSGKAKVNWTAKGDIKSDLSIQYFIAIYQNESKDLSQSIANSQLAKLEI